MQKKCLCYTTKDYFCLFKLWYRNESFSLEAIDLTFAHTNFQLEKIIFYNIKKMMVKQDIFFAKLARHGYFDLFKLNQFKTLSSFVSTFIFSVSRKLFVSASISSSKKSCCSSSCVAVFESYLNKK